MEEKERILKRSPYLKAALKPDAILLEEPKNGRPKWLFPTLAIALLIAAIYGVRALQFSAGHEATDDAFITSHVISISPKFKESFQRCSSKTISPSKKASF